MRVNTAQTDQATLKPTAVAPFESQELGAEDVSASALFRDFGGRSFMRSLGENLRRKLRRIFYDEQWFVGVRPNVSGPGALELKEFLVLKPPSDRFFADPFVVERDGRSYLFMEEYPFSKRKGVISCIEFSPRGFIGSPTVVLETEHHLSYPFIFDWNGETYMLPESSESGRLGLFRAVEFPFRWEFDRNLIEDVWAVDSTIFEHEGRFWMFTSGVSKNAKVNRDLFLYYAESPLGKWYPHPLNPVVSDDTRARPAGKVFMHDGSLIRPGQDCSERYGKAITLNRIDELSPTTYRETPTRVLEPDWYPGNIGTHTLNHSEHYQTLDARILIPNPKMFASKIWWSLCERFRKSNT